MRPSTKAWLALGAGVAAYDIFSPPGETLSEAVDVALESDPFKRTITLAAIGVTALHLCNLLPERVDPFHHALKWKDYNRHNEI